VDDGVDMTARGHKKATGSATVGGGGDVTAKGIRLAMPEVLARNLAVPSEIEVTVEDANAWIIEAGWVVGAASLIAHMPTR